MHQAYRVRGDTAKTYQSSKSRLVLQSFIQYHYFSHGVKRGDHFLVSNRKGQAWLIWMTGTCSGSLVLAMCWLFPRCHFLTRSQCEGCDLPKLSFVVSWSWVPSIAPKSQKFWTSGKRTAGALRRWRLWMTLRPLPLCPRLDMLDWPFWNVHFLATESSAVCIRH